ncbi:MAG: hypothetical protein ACRYFS_03795 [Janthinobacterium lividum]
MNICLALAFSASILSFASTGHAQIATTITDNGSTFTPGASDISQLDSSGGLDNSADYSNNYTPGQSFVTGSNLLGYSLNSLTLKGSGGSGGNMANDTFTVRIESIGSNQTSLTPLATFTAAANSITNNSDFFTFDLSAAKLTLAEGTNYAFDLQSANPGDGGTYYFGLARSGGDAYSGGEAFNEDNYNGSNIQYPKNYDRTFDLGLTSVAAVPEASTLVSLSMGVFVLAGLMLKARRRFSADSQQN